jgi:hypothetical protein
MITEKIPVLFVHSKSNYKKDIDFDCYDEKRNALNFNSNQAVITHPPCRLFSRLKGLTQAPETEKQFASFSLDLVRKNGGILEHPFDSSFWKLNNIVKPGYIDEFGGFTLLINQSWFGYYTHKKTLLYIVGIKPKDIPDYSFYFDPYKIRKFQNLTQKQRSETTVQLVNFLKQIIIKINLNKNKL